MFIISLLGHIFAPQLLFFLHILFVQCPKCAAFHWYLMPINGCIDLSLTLCDMRYE
jgi:hypothetical protein